MITIMIQTYMLNAETLDYISREIIACDGVESDSS